jgi:oligoribonuclease NrnB/cAMP/cGMP phosphodiesterase (DHH superfamily)
MKRTKLCATDLMTRHHIPHDKDFFTLSFSEVENVLNAADEWKYKKPVNANGSKARYFHAFLTRLIARK